MTETTDAPFVDAYVKSDGGRKVRVPRHLVDLSDDMQLTPVQRDTDKKSTAATTPTKKEN